MSLLSRFAHVQGSLKSVATLVVALGIATTAAYAQQQPSQTRPAQQPQEGQPAVPPSGPQQPQNINMVPNPGQAWTKICGKEEGGADTCLVTREFVMDNNYRGITVTVYDIGKPQNAKHIRVLVPLGFKLKPGVRFFIDKNQPVAGYYDVCLPPGCYVNFENATDIVNNMLKGKDALLTVRDAAGGDINVHFPIEGFKAAFEGAAIDPDAIEAERKKLEEDLIKKSDEMRLKLLGGSAGSAPTETTAPVAPPTAAP